MPVCSRVLGEADRLWGWRFGKKQLSIGCVTYSSEANGIWIIQSFIMVLGNRGLNCLCCSLYLCVWKVCIFRLFLWAWFMDIIFVHPNLCI